MGCGSLQFILKWNSHAKQDVLNLAFQKFTDTLVASQSNSVKEKLHFECSRRRRCEADCCIGKILNLNIKLSDWRQHLNIH